MNFDHYPHNSSDTLAFDSQCPDEDIGSGTLDGDPTEGSDSLSILDIIKAKLFGATNTSTSLDASTGSGTEQLSLKPAWNSTLQDSDEESRASKDSRDSSNAMTVASSSSSKQKAIAKHQKTKRRFFNAYAQQTTPAENLYAQDRNTPQPLSEQKEKVQDKDLYLR